MKQTAVDFLMGKLFDPSTMVAEQIQWFEQAKEMYRKQIKDAYSAGVWEIGCFNRNPDAKEYYNKTYNDNK